MTLFFDIKWNYFPKMCPIYPILLLSRKLSNNLRLKIFRKTRNFYKILMLDWLIPLSEHQLEPALQVLLRKGVLNICSKFTGQYPCHSIISTKLESKFIEITLLHGCSVNLLHIFRTPFHWNTSRGLLLISIVANTYIIWKNFERNSVKFVTLSSTFYHHFNKLW